MADWCPKCGAELDAFAPTCPSCKADVSVPLPDSGAGVGGAVPLPSPEKGSAARPGFSVAADFFADPGLPGKVDPFADPGAGGNADPFADPGAAGGSGSRAGTGSPGEGSRSAIEDLFDDFDPMAEFAPPTDPGQNLTTLAGLELTPPPPAASLPQVARQGGDDVLDFIDTGFEPPQLSAEPTPPSAGAPTARGDRPEPPAPSRESVLEGWPPKPTVPAPAEERKASPVISAARPSEAVERATAIEQSIAVGRTLGGRTRQMVLLALGAAFVGILAVFGLQMLWGSPAKKAAPQQEVVEAVAVEAGKGAAPPARPEERPVSGADEAAQARADGAARPAPEAAMPAGQAPAGDAERLAVEAGKESEAVAAREGSSNESGAERAPQGEAPADPLAQAEALEREEKWEEALAAYLALTAADSPHAAEAHLRRSRILWRTGERARAVLEAKRALAADESRLDLHLHYGALLEEMGSLRDALEVYERALVGREGEEAVLAPLAGLYLEMGTPWKAIARLEPQVKTGAPESLRLLLGEAYVQAGAWGRATETLQPIQDHPRAAFLLGRALLERGDTRAALPHLERAARQDGIDPVVHRHLGYAYKELGRRADAARSFRTYLEREPKAVDRREIEDEIAGLTP